MIKPVVIVIEKTTREHLKHIARKDQTYDDILNELLDLKEKTEE